MEKLENLLNKVANKGRYYTLSTAGVSAEINKINYQSDLLFMGLAIAVSAAAGYSVYKYFKSLKRGY
ncbi:MAG: hypothetical protein M1580_00050 [Candidatus Parvarchaeota archaeon]|nr:hypothetical protein [Candidatus Parvarchaeota archaeon]